MTPHVLRLWWLGSGEVDACALQAIAASLEDTFAMTARVETLAARPDAYDARRGQHSSTRLLAWIGERLPADASKALGLTDVDLFIPILTFVFGEAQLGGRAAVASCARLGGTPGKNGAALLRLAKEAAHELGHTLGLLHCEQSGCVMSRSASLADVDRKGTGLCRDCRLRLQDLHREEFAHERR
jgi:archaemetzincin